MSRTGLYDCHILKICFDDFMSNINCGIGVFDDQFFIVSVDRAYKEVSTQKY